MKISRIANFNAGGERGAKADQFTYWLWHDTIKTQILNWSEKGRNHMIASVVRFQPGQIPAVLCPVRVTNPARQSGSGFWPGLEPNQNKPLVKTLTAGGLPRPIANTTFISISSICNPINNCWVTLKNGQFLAWFHSNATNSAWIPNWRMGVDRVSKRASCTYISYCDMIRTHMPNWSQSSGFAKISNEPRIRGFDVVWYFDGAKSVAMVPVRLQPRTRTEPPSWNHC